MLLCLQCEHNKMHCEELVPTGATKRTTTKPTQSCLATALSRCHVGTTIAIIIVTRSVKPRLRHPQAVRCESEFRVVRKLRPQRSGRIVIGSFKQRPHRWRIP